MTRYALYFAPPPGSDLAAFGAAWLGRDAFSGERIALEEVGDMLPWRQEEITENARRYGFHATLKAPFALADGQSEAALIAALDAFASQHTVFTVPSLALQSVGGFIALVLEERSAQMDAFAEACVRDFDGFRAPLSPADRERRLKAPLTERQIAYLDQWGYPYVMDEFFFHMTLTSRLSDVDEQAMILEVLEPVAAVLGEAPLTIDALCLFSQPDRDAPFTVRHRAPLA